MVRYILSLTNGNRHMTAADFRRIALSLEGVEEYSHAGLPAFRVGGRKFASLASQAEGYGNRLQTKKDSIPIAVRPGPAISPHPPQPPAATFRRLYRTREEHLARLHAVVKTRLR